MDRQLPNMQNQQLKSGSDQSGIGGGATSRSFAGNNACAKNGNRQNNNRVALNNRYQNKTYKRESRSIAQSIKDTIESGKHFPNDSRRSLLLDAQIPKTKKSVKISIKERFVQANCQFLLTEDKDYSQYASNPDAPINWEFVEEVYLTCTASEFCCPVCLYYPTAAKITRCGHVYCWACILHYLGLSDKDHRSCPICYENIRQDELKSVIIKKKIDFAENNYLTFNLMKLRKGSVAALPVECEKSLEPSSKYRMFIKHVVASSNELFAILDREKEELKVQLKEYQEENMPEVCFVQNALDNLAQRTTQLKRVQALKKELNFEIGQHSTEVDTSDEKEAGGGGEFLYFYQSDDGQHIYLHPLNIRMLKHEFGDLRNCPSTITAKMIELHRESVTEDGRRRLPHIRHLPISCEYQIAEMELDNLIVSNATLREFENEINNRKRNRKRKEKTQKQRDRNIEIENNKRILGIWSGPSYKMNQADFPLFQEENLENNPEAFPTFELSDSPPTFSGPSTSSSSEPQSSFARMLSTGKTTFNHTYHPKENTGNTGVDVDEDTEMAAAVNNLTLSDFFDDCIRTKVKKNKKKK